MWFHSKLIPALTFNHHHMHTWLNSLLPSTDTFPTIGLLNYADKTEPFFFLPDFPSRLLSCLSPGGMQPAAHVARRVPFTHGASLAPPAAAGQALRVKTLLLFGIKWPFSPHRVSGHIFLFTLSGLLPMSQVLLLLFLVRFFFPNSVLWIIPLGLCFMVINSLTFCFFPICC